jgi:septal ring factor EnvC (AmiA/AmiB activator)
VHRWRKLEGSDPELLDLLARYASVQRRLIVKTEEVVERDLMLADKEERVAELKAHLAAQPGPELAEQLTQTQHLLSERTRQLKSVASEVNMWQTQVGEARYEVARLKEALAEARRVALEEKARGRAAGAGAGARGVGGGSHAGKPGSGEAQLVVLGASGGVRGGGFTAPVGLL